MITKEVTSWEQVDYTDMKAPIITIYKYPKDYPDKFVARLFDLNNATNVFMLGNTYGQIRYKIPRHMHRFPRDVRDDPVIVESWL